ncbi:MAG: copper amine oxidase N-terminal domain-containing protein [Clostridiales bacterium]|jgi:hypothetical protein|nr:copper amine oxidase N-terminal domain-containing protein [Clostridiales bacterium]
MRRKIIALFVALCAALALPSAASPHAAYAAAQDMKQLRLGETGVVALPQGPDRSSAYFSFTAQEDGLYEYHVTSSRSRNGTYGTVRYDYGFFSKNGAVLFPKDDNAGEQSLRFGDANILSGLWEGDFATYLHKGEYIFGFKDVSTGSNPWDFTVKVEKAAEKLRRDKEPNDTRETAIPATGDGVFEGYLAGCREDGTRDSNDYFVFDISTTGKHAAEIESDQNTSVSIFESETGKRIGRMYAESTTFYASGHGEKGEIDFPAAGRYILQASDNGSRFGSYKITIDGAKIAGGANASANSAGARVTRLAAAPTAVGVKLDWSPSDDPGGYRVFRDGIALNDSPIYGGSYVDIHAESNTTYAYAVQPFGASAAAVDTESAARTETATGEISGLLPTDGTEGERMPRGFILMQIGKDTMSVNGNVVEIDPGRGTTPVVINERTMAPIRAIIEAMDGSVGWDEGAARVSLGANGRSVEMWLEQNEILVDGAPQTIDVAPTTVNDRTMLPIRFVAENVGCAIEWIGSAEEIVIVF